MVSFAGMHSIQTVRLKKLFFKAKAAVSDTIIWETTFDGIFK